MAKNKFFEPAELGLYPRADDRLTDEPSNVARIEELLSWYKPILAQEKDKKPSAKTKTKKARHLIDQGLEIERIAKLKGVKNVKSASQSAFVLDRLTDVAEDGFYAILDFLSQRKVKSSLTILGGIGVGAGIGALLGTFVFPGIGTAIGGTVGAAISSALGAVGGTLGTTILGAFVGSWFGKKSSDKLFKNEKRFQLSKRYIRKIKKVSGTNTQTIDMMNGYLYNRYKSVNSKTLKAYYKNLRKNAFRKANEQSINHLGLFFAKEMTALIAESKKLDSNPAQLNHDLMALQVILKNLSNSKLAESVKEEINQSLAAFETYVDSREGFKEAPVKETVEDLAESHDHDLKESVKSEPVVEKPKATTKLATAHPQMLFSEDSQHMGSEQDALILKSMLSEVQKDIQSDMKKHGYTTPDVSEEVLASETGLDFDLSEHNLPMINMRMSRKEEQDFANLTTDVDPSNTKQLDEVLSVLLLQAKALNKKMGLDQVMVLSDGEESIAIKYAAALIAENIEPLLDSDEYPDPKQQAEILRKAHELAKDFQKDRTLHHQKHIV